MNQETALSILKSGHNVYLTGSAGTGKTYLINEYVEYLRQREVPVAITASTGIAATHIGGQTIHSWSGIGIKERITYPDLERISKNKQTRDRLENAKVLIIDEISMLSGKILTGISDILKHFKKSSKAFGGIQVILSGDFFQLPPVSRQGLPNREKFAFMAPVWVDAGLKVCYLTDQYRQGQDSLANLLAEIRNKDVTDDSVMLIQDKLREQSDDLEVLRLFTHNADVDEMNTKRLADNPNVTHVFEAKTEGKSNIVESLKQSVLAAPRIELKLDARVMFVRNNPEKGYFNGTMGTIIDFDGEEGWPKVKTTEGRVIICKPEEWTVVDEKETILASYKQVPLRLAWAITVHKSQGMTLDGAEMDLSKTFETGQGYVALSRLKTWEGLKLKGINNNALAVDDLAFRADVRFKELSRDNENEALNIAIQDMKLRWANFIERCGGTNDEEVIKSNQEREKKYLTKATKESTYVKTKKLVQKGMSLELIAFERDLTLGTVINHLEQIRAEDSKIDLSKYAPDAKTMEKVEKAVEKLKAQGNEEFFDKDGNIRLGYIHTALNKKLDYDTIRLARMFLV
ncbi:MAG: AAA family ATPase [Cyclobacteriaceae bacterium]